MRPEKVDRMVWARLAAPLVFAAVLVAGAAGIRLAQSSAPAAQVTRAAPEAVPVQTARAARRNVPVMLSTIGAVQAYHSVLVRARVDGTLTRVLFKEGQMVKAGDGLAQLDPRPYAAALAQAMAKKAADTAMLQTAQKDLFRFSSLARDQFASRQSVDQQTGQVGQLQATLLGDDAAIATAKLNLDFCNITSPISSRTGLRLVDAGNLIHSSDPTGLVTITQVQPIAVLFTLPQDDLPPIHDAMRAGTLPVLAYTAEDRTGSARASC